MKVTEINTTNTFRPISVVPYPEFKDLYRKSEQVVYKSDALEVNPLVAFANKLALAYKVLFSPEIDIKSKEIKQGIDLICNSKVKKLDIMG